MKPACLQALSENNVNKESWSCVLISNLLENFQEMYGMGMGMIFIFIQAAIMC